MRYAIISITLAIGVFLSCKHHETQTVKLAKFDPVHIKVKNPVKKVKAQTFYLPVYSSIPFAEGKSFYGLSSFMAVHNTDFNNPIYITSVYYLDTEGNLIKDFLLSRVDTVMPMQTVNYFVPESDRSGVGANFILEWMADSAVNEPLVETIMVSLTSGQGVSFSSKGKILNELY
ncbi:DUF3124 domain-containing protein [Tenuifilum osseticum]|uniref:DUF3124 domain-containing protein n=1 Tax=Tenuifilum osseticum TaxID=3374723 RepID=UPI0034E3A06C